MKIKAEKKMDIKKKRNEFEKNQNLPLIKARLKSNHQKCIHTNYLSEYVDELFSQNC